MHNLFEALQLKRQWMKTTTMATFQTVSQISLRRNQNIFPRWKIVNNLPEGKTDFKMIVALVVMWKKKGFTFCFVLRFRILSFTLITKRSFPSGFSHQLLHSRTTGDFWVKTFLDIYSLLKPCRRTLSSITKNCWKGSNDSLMTFPSFRAESMRFLMQRFAMFNRFNLSTLHWASRLLSGIALELNVLTRSFPKFSSVSSSSKLADAILFFSLRNRWLSR